MIIHSMQNAIVVRMKQHSFKYDNNSHIAVSHSIATYQRFIPVSQDYYNQWKIVMYVILSVSDFNTVQLKLSLFSIIIIIDYC